MIELNGNSSYNLFMTWDDAVSNLSNMYTACWAMLELVFCSVESLLPPFFLRDPLGKAAPLLPSYL